VNLRTLYLASQPSAIRTLLRLDRSHCPCVGHDVVIQIILPIIILVKWELCEPEFTAGVLYYRWKIHSEYILWLVTSWLHGIHLVFREGLQSVSSKITAIVT